MLYLIPMNTDFTIRRMELSDIDDLIALGAAIEWKMIPENWLLTLEPFPEHCFVAIADGKLAGSAVSCCYDGKHAGSWRLIPAEPLFCWIPRRTG